MIEEEKLCLDKFYPVDFLKLQKLLRMNQL